MTFEEVKTGILFLTAIGFLIQLADRIWNRGAKEAGTGSEVKANKERSEKNSNDIRELKISINDGFKAVNEKFEGLNEGHKNSSDDIRKSGERRMDNIRSECAHQFERIQKEMADSHDITSKAIAELDKKLIESFHQLDKRIDSNLLEMRIQLIETIQTELSPKTKAPRRRTTKPKE